MIWHSWTSQICTIQLSFWEYLCIRWDELQSYKLFLSIRCLVKLPWTTPQKSTGTTTSRLSLKQCCCFSGGSCIMFAVWYCFWFNYNLIKRSPMAWFREDRSLWIIMQSLICQVNITMEILVCVLLPSLPLESTSLKDILTFLHVVLFLV